MATFFKFFLSVYRSFPLLLTWFELETKNNIFCCARGRLYQTEIQYDFVNGAKSTKRMFDKSSLYSVLFLKVHFENREKASEGR